MKEYIIGKTDAGQRLDKYLKRVLPQNTVYKELRRKNIKVNGARADCGYLIQGGDRVSVYVHDKYFAVSTDLQIRAVDADVKVIYEDENILVVSKPPGLPSQPDSKHRGDTLIDWILNYLNYPNCIGQSENYKPAICNRLDTNTEGLIIAGKNYGALRCINDNMDSVRKFYTCTVAGVPKEPSGIINIPLKKDTARNISYPDIGGKSCATAYKVTGADGGNAVLEIELLTGRSHQIRAHLKAIGHPILSDRKYGGTGGGHYGLSAHKLIFNIDKEPLRYLKGLECRL